VQLCAHFFERLRLVVDPEMVLDNEPLAVGKVGDRPRQANGLGMCHRLALGIRGRRVGD
jgi:hypothetical protein